MTAKADTRTGYVGQRKYHDKWFDAGNIMYESITKGMDEWRKEKPDTRRIVQRTITDRVCE